MIFKKVKAITLTLALLAGCTISLTVKAATVPGTLGSAYYSTDVWTFACGTGTTKVQIRVTDGRNPINSLAAVYASFAEDGSPTLTVADTESTTLPSSWSINTTDGSGTYVLVIRKSAAGMEDYLAEALCLNSLGSVIGPASFKLIHNQ